MRTQADQIMKASRVLVKSKKNCHYITISRYLNAKVGGNTENEKNRNIRMFGLKERNNIG